MRYVDRLCQLVSHPGNIRYVDQCKCFNHICSEWHLFPSLSTDVHISNEENNALNQWSKYESSTRPINDPGANAYGDQQAEFNPRRTIMHKFFIFYSIIAGVSAFFLALGQFLGTWLNLNVINFSVARRFYNVQTKTLSSF